jgi:predicted RNase H-like nuclease (RuvC/YqgF family)
MSLRFSLLVGVLPCAVSILLLCAVNIQAQTPSPAATVHLETVEEYFLRGEVATVKDDIIALRKDVEAQKIQIDGLHQEVKALQTAINNLKSDLAKPQESKAGT